MIWATRTLSTKMDKIFILPRDKSDHSAIEMIINQKRTPPKWRFDDNLMRKAEDIQRYKILSKEYFEFNDSPEIKDATLWDTYKVVIRGHLIQQKARMKKEKTKKLDELNLEIGKKEIILKKSPNNSEASKELKTLKKEKYRLELEETAKQLRFIKQYNFENANKPGAWLMRKIRKKRQNQQIIQIKKEDKIITKDDEILQEFEEFYSQLYKEETIDLTKIVQYLGNQKLEKITEDQRGILNKEISEKEVKNAIRSLKLNKAPGPDGFTAGFYKTMQEEIVVYLKRVMNKVLRNKEFPDTWRDAEIIVMPKEDQDTTNVRNYRPISLLNLDYKIFTCILANRFKEFLLNWVGQDQTGFLPGRKMSDNVRCILDIIEYYEWNHQKELALLSIDAEKAFDNLNWSFFKLLFKEIDIGFQFYNAIDTIYEDQRAKIRINGQHSQNIKIGKGVRQGCPLSPLIFIFALEVLLKNLKKDQRLKGTKIGTHEFKVRAFADDIICIIEDPRSKLHMWLSKIQDYGEVTGFHINKKKSKILTKNISKTNQEIIQNMTGISVTKKIKYLGIWLMAKNAHLLENNYNVKWKEIKKDLQKWQHLNISLLGRIATIKMNILPKILYLFQTLPIIRTIKTFTDWNKDLSKFIWNGKKPRIKYAMMTDKKDRGGFGLPNFRLYFEACALSWIKDWCNLKREHILNLEGFDLRRGWHAYIWYDKKQIEKNFGNHFIRSALIKVWEKYKRFMYVRTPLWISPLEENSRKLLGWPEWPTYKEILYKRDDSYQIKPLEQIKKKYKNLTWLQYAQIKQNFLVDNEIGFTINENFWDKILQNDKKEITKIYDRLLDWMNATDEVKNCMLKWAKNIGRSISMEEWEVLWKKKQKYTYAWDLKENWLKSFHRWYITPKKLGEMYKETQNTCWKCKTHIGSYFHSWWSCSETRKYWKMIHLESQKILKKTFPLKPEYYLLGLTDLETNFNSNEDKIFTYISTAARIIFAKYWKLQDVPTKDEWLGKVDDIRDMDELTFLLRSYRVQSTNKTDWNLFRDYMATNIT
uniref:Reverse transcriptase domain-containing protein n=1 Tax=Anolis carolinensis TaxID=28377 RepID=A0A803TUP7_ANOCA